MLRISFRFLLLILLSLVSLGSADPDGYTHIATLDDGTKVYASRVKRVGYNHYSSWLLMNEQVSLFEFRKQGEQVFSRFFIQETNDWDKWSPSPPGSFAETVYENLVELHSLTLPSGFAVNSVNVDGTDVSVHLKSSVRVSGGYYRAWVLVSTMDKPVLLDLQKRAGELRRRVWTGKSWSSWTIVDNASNFGNVYRWLEQYHRKEGGPYGRSLSLPQHEARLSLAVSKLNFSLA